MARAVHTDAVWGKPLSPVATVLRDQMAEHPDFKIETYLARPSMWMQPFTWAGYWNWVAWHVRRSDTSKSKESKS